MARPGCAEIALVGGGADCGKCDGVAAGLDVNEAACGMPADAGIVH